MSININSQVKDSSYQVILRKADASQDSTLPTTANGHIDTTAEALAAIKIINPQAVVQENQAMATLKMLIGIQEISADSSKSAYDVYVDFDKNPMGYWFAWGGTTAGIRSIDGNKVFKVSKAEGYGGFGVDTDKGENTVAKKEGKRVSFPDFAIKDKGYKNIVVEITGSKLPSKMKVEVTDDDGNMYEVFFSPKQGVNVLETKELADLELNVNISKLQFGFEAGTYDFALDNIGFSK